MTRQKRAAGFTLIELMIVVTILGVLASVAMPTFTTYLRRSRTSDAFGNLDAMFKSVSVYYNRDFASAGAVDSADLAHCTVAESSSFPGLPGSSKQAYVETPEFSLGTGIAFPPGFSYFKFTNVGGVDGCSRPPETLHYLLTANGDLDDDTTMSTFSMATMSSSSNELYKAGNIYIENELE